MFCKYCGNEIADNSKFCTNCGNEIHPIRKMSNDNDVQQQKVVDNNEKKIEDVVIVNARHKSVAKVVLPVILVIIICGVFIATKVISTKNNNNAVNNADNKDYFVAEDKDNALKNDDQKDDEAKSDSSKILEDMDRGYTNEITVDDVENNEKTQGWEEILNYIVEEAGHFKTAKEWQEAQEAFGEQLRKGVARESGDNAQAADGAVRLLTVHASKGLEFDSVWIPDCNEKNFPHGNGLDPEHIEEERRIFYVAMTRAKKDLELLCLTGTAERPRFPSRFLIPLNRYRR